METMSLMTTPSIRLVAGTSLAAVLALCGAAVAAAASGTPIPQGSKIYVEEIEHGLDEHIVAAILSRKQNVPIKLIAVAGGADYFLRGTFMSVGATGYAAVNLVDSKGLIVWAASTNKTSDSGIGLMAIAREIADRLAKAIATK